MSLATSAIHTAEFCLQRTYVRARYDDRAMRHRPQHLRTVTCWWKSMSPHEDSPLLPEAADDGVASPSEKDRRSGTTTISRLLWRVVLLALIFFMTLTILLTVRLIYRRHHPYYSGEYQLVECQEGHNLFDYYTFRNGSDSIGSDGFNTYVSYKRAKELDIVDVRPDKKGGKPFVCKCLLCTCIQHCWSVAASY